MTVLCNVTNHLFLKAPLVDFVAGGRHMKTEHDVRQTEGKMNFFSKAHGTVTASDRIRHTH